LFACLLASTVVVAAVAVDRDVLQCVVFHPNSTYIVTGSLDCTLRLWDVQTGCGAGATAAHSASSVAHATAVCVRVCACDRPRVRAAPACGALSATRRRWCASRCRPTAASSHPALSTAPSVCGTSAFARCYVS
jgi:hypothetical protein